jgi:oligopeptide transport system substrate-binding protein
MKRTLTLILAVALIVSLAAGMTACAGADTGANICVGSEPGTLDPNMNETVDGMIYITHLYEGLYRPNTDGTFSLGQAKDVQITENADGTFHVVAILRDDIKWSDGKPVTAHDFEYSWKRLCDPANGYSYGYIVRTSSRTAMMCWPKPSRPMNSA